MPTPKRSQNSSNLWKSIIPHISTRHFENEVIKFHAKNKTPIRHLPYVLGKRINLRKLYINVIKRGGYKKVNEKEVWDDILSELNLPKEGTNCELAIQSIYHRYLEAYECNQWNCLSSGTLIDTNIDTNVNLDITISRHSAILSDLTMRDRSVLGSFVYENTPKIYSDYQHIISNSIRSESGLSCDLKDETELNHLTMSLKSGLYNEIDFALNTLLIMSNSDRLSPDLRFTGDLLELVLATTGIVDISPGSFFEQFKNSLWMMDSLKFWNKTVEDETGRIFLIPNIFTCSKSDMKQIQLDFIAKSWTDCDGLFNDDQHLEHPTIDSCCQRIHLVTTIIHNLVINSLYNSQTIVNNNQALRFLFLGAHSRDTVLRRLSLNTLTKLRFVLFPIQDNSVTGLQTLLYTPDNLSRSIDKDDDSDEEWFTEFLLDFLMSLLSSDNRSDRISAYEMIQSLCFIEDNHETLSKHLQNPFVVSLSSQLYVPDIHPLCCALEALVSLSQLGEDMCRRMAMCKSLLKCLLQFVNIEAQMFGPNAVYKIKTFNSRPPIPAANYHSVPQIMRLPGQSSLRDIAPFVNHPVVGGPVPSFNHNYIRSPNVNAISPHSLSTALVNPAQYQQNNMFIFNQSRPPPNTSQLTPLQQIDNLLTKSIASFSTPLHDSMFPDTITSSVENTQLTSKESALAEQVSKKEKPQKERRVIQIKCCVDGVDLDIEEINGTCRSDRELNGDKVLYNGTATEAVVNGDEGTETKDDTGNESLLEEKEEQHFFSNGTSLEVDVMNEDEDPDRRQMPPPSLPTPSMLKKQMRPKSSQFTSTNGYMLQMNKDKYDTTPTLNNDKNLSEDRREQLKKWLCKKYHVINDNKLFVPKQQLIDDLHHDLFDGETDVMGATISPHDLHACIKDIFGQKVQVKVEHSVNGSSQLIYCNLGRIELPTEEKSNLNGVVNSCGEMNGFINHCFKRKLSQEEVDEVIEQKKLCHENKGNMKCADETEGKDIRDVSSKGSNVSSSILLLIKKKLKYRRKLEARCRRKYKWRYQSKVKVVSSTRVSSLSRSRKSTKDYCKVPSDKKRPLLASSICDYVHRPVPCLWGPCVLRFVDPTSLQTHVTNDHLSVSALDVFSPPRSFCQWQECVSSHVPRAPLSLLSHVIQDHCVANIPISLLPPNIPMNEMGFGTLQSQPSNNPFAINTMVPSNIKQNNVVSNTLYEKSGWSVLYDHFRMDEQCQPNLPEGPITKHIRISSSIILRNMSRHSIIAKEFLRSHEKYLSTVALSNQDCSSVIVQCLDELWLPSCGADDRHHDDQS